MKVSIIVTTLNRRRLLDQCLRSLFDQTYRDFEVIVVDGGSTDGTPELAKNFPVKFVRQGGQYIPNGENCGIRASRGEILAFIDDDAIADKNWLRLLVASFEQREISGVGGRVVIPEANSATVSANKLTPYTMLRDVAFSAICENKLGQTGQVLRGGYVTANLDRLFRSAIEVSTVQGCNMSFRRLMFEEIGLFDESFTGSAFRFETEFCLRARARGHRLIYNSDAVVYHRAHGAHVSWAEGSNLAKNLFYNSYNNVLFVLRGRRLISRFSWFRFLLIQLFSMEEYLRLAVRRKRLGYLRGSIGILAAFRAWISNFRDSRTGRIPLLQRPANLQFIAMDSRA